VLSKAPPVEDVAVAAAAFLAQPTSPRTWQQAVGWAAGQSVHRDKDWTGRCQEFCHDCYGIGGGFASALAQWHGLDDSDRHVGGSPKDAPLGAMLFSQGRNPGALSFRFGHIIVKTRPFTGGELGAWSTDALRTGWPDKIDPVALYSRWNHAYLGYGLNMNGVDLQVQQKRAIVKPQLKPYDAIAAAAVRTGKAIEAMQKSLATAKGTHDAADVARIKEAIAQLRESKARLERMADRLKHA
jgi:hypothetical protein